MAFNYVKSLIIEKPKGDTPMRKSLRIKFLPPKVVTNLSKMNESVSKQYKILGVIFSKGNSSLLSQIAAGEDSFSIDQENFTSR